jgi:predicted DCC family thiol-disulfide oxidoreductase YuxK
MVSWPSTARHTLEAEGTGNHNSDFAIEVYYDGECPVCIRFVDITAPGFDPEQVGVPWEDLMDRIHGRLPDGTLVEGVDVFRCIYTAIGFSRIAALTRLPGIAQLLEVGYRAFARNRLRVTGRCRDDACGVGAERAATRTGDA